jgi:hypothetical protein
MNDISDSNTSEVLHTLWRSEWAVALPALAPWLKASTNGEISRTTSAAQTAFQGGLVISVQLSCRFKRLQFDNHFYVAVFKAILVKASILLAVIYKHEKEQCEILQGINFS